VHSRDEPFVATDPFRPQRHSHLHGPPHDLENANEYAECAYCNGTGTSAFRALGEAVEWTARQVYLHVLLRLPSLYWSRVCRIFEDAAVGRKEMSRMIAAARTRISSEAEVDAGERERSLPPEAHAAGVRPLHGSHLLPFPEDWRPPNVSPALARFKQSWEAFVDTLMREWKTLNVLSALLLS
jgi:hypothetical protein